MTLVNSSSTVVVERAPGHRLTIDVTSARYSAVLAAQASARVFERAGKRIGYVHFWYIHAGCVTLLRKLAKGEFATCDALILDLRGRGGSASEARRIVRFVDGVVESDERNPDPVGLQAGYVATAMGAG